LIALFGPEAAPFLAKAIGVGCAGASLALACALSRRLAAEDSRLACLADVAGVLAAGVLAVSPSLAVNSMSGLETTLFGALLVAGTWLGTESIVSGRWRGAGVAFAAAALTRPEGAMVFAAYGMAQAASVWWAALVGSGSAARELARRSNARQLLLDGVIVTAAVLAHLAFRMIAYDGEMLPNTYFAKIGGALNSAPPRLYVHQGLAIPFGGTVGVLVAVAGMLLKPSGLRLALPAMAVVAAGATAPFITGSDWMYGWRLTAPYLPIAASLVAVGWCAMAASLAPARIRRIASVALLAVVPLLWLHQDRYRAFFHRVLRTERATVAQPDEALADWLRFEVAKPGDFVALTDIGEVGFRCIDQRILDLSGLTDRDIAKAPGGFLEKRYDPQYVLDKRPRFVALLFFQPQPEGSVAPQMDSWKMLDFERRLFSQVEFQQWYTKSPEPGDEPADWRLALQRRVGAARVFERRKRGMIELYAVFERLDRQRL
jgi:hypothetical protein